jgi:predicted glycoside hydrolase/deacetylase ChbG (UPF0249 family)
MAARLILNADDFGLTRGVNRAIGELASAGALTSATLMANGAAFDEAVAIAQQHSGLSIGCHVVLTDGVPVSAPKTISSLLRHPGKVLRSHEFRSSLVEFHLAVLLGKVDESEIELEAIAQIQKLQHAGIRVTHIDTHKHTHILPGVARPLLAAAEHCGVPAVRNPFEPSWALALGGNAFLRQLQVRMIQALRPRFLALRQIRDGSIRTTDGTLGVSATGNLNASTLHTLLDAMPDGTWELVCHPGHNDSDLDAITTRLRATREIERDALLAAFCETSTEHAQPSGPKLISYKALLAQEPL